MITLHDLLDNFCCTDPYIDYAIVNIKTGEVLVDRVHDKTCTIDDVDDYNKFLPYARKQIRAWEAELEDFFHNQKLRVLERNDTAAVPHRTYGFSKKRDAKLCGRIAK